MYDTKYYVDADGKYLGGYSGTVPANGIEVSAPPNHGLDIWNGTSWDAYEPTLSAADIRGQAMYAGIEFEGVMCSALKEDQWGLNSIKDFVVAGSDVPFEFMNGNTLVLTSVNISEFEAVWIPFRFGFFQ